MLQSMEVVRFTNNVEVVETALTCELIEELMNAVLKKIHEWMSRHGLQVAPYKSKATVLTRELAYISLRLLMDSYYILVVKSA